MSLENCLQRLMDRQTCWMDLGLDRVSTVGDIMLSLPFDFPVITVAGTNGKGSVVHALESVYREAGYRVGMYTSPHLYDFRERFQVNNQLLPEAHWVDVFERLFAEETADNLTFFEFTTLAALLLAADSKLDVLLLEVGMGGRLDAVNIIPKSLSIITNVALDHTQYLGDTREKIAKEKAGILVDGVPAIFGEADIVTLLSGTADLNKKVFVAERDFSYEQGSQEGSSILYHSIKEGSYPVSLPPGILPENITTALAALEVMNEAIPVTLLEKQKGIAKMYLPARQEQRYVNGVRTLIDVAHNPQAVDSLLTRVGSLPESARLYCVFSALNDKDIASMLSCFRGLPVYWFLFELEGPRAMPLEELKSRFDAEGLKEHYEAGQLSDLWLQLWEKAQAQDVVLLFGSFQVVSAVQPYLEKEA